MQIAAIRPDIGRSALVIADMQNDFVHPDGYFGHRARVAPGTGIDMPFLTDSIPSVKRLAAAFREAERPVIYIAHVVKPDYPDAQFPTGASGFPAAATTRSLPREPGVRKCDLLRDN